MTTEYIPGVDAPDDPWVQLWQKVWDEHGEEGELTNYRIYGMSQAYTFVQALQAAGEDLTRDGIVEAHRGGGGRLRGAAARAVPLHRGQPHGHLRHAGRRARRAASASR